jgi:hypothetical protein|tara:strand:+ start:87 stop:530 length:444 start_codon:yes stop_codon:yes gene_type:complete
MNLIKLLFKPESLKVIVDSFKGKALLITVPLVIIISSFIIYGLAVWASLFIIIYENGFSFYIVLDIAAGQWAEVITSYTPQWLIEASSWPALILSILWSTFIGFLPLILTLIWGTIILIYGAAYLFGFIGHFFLFLKKLILSLISGP